MSKTIEVPTSGFLSTSLDQPDENGNTTISGDTTIMTFREFKIKDGSIANKQEHT